MVKRIATLKINPITSMIALNLTPKTEKQEMHYLNYHNALWDCFGFHIAQIGNML